MAKSFDILKNQKSEKEIELNDLYNLKKLQLGSGIYCPLNFQNNLEEIDFMENMLYSPKKEYQKTEFAINSVSQKENLNCFLFKLSSYDGSNILNEILQNLNQYKIKIIEIKISKDFEFKRTIQENLELFNQNFSQNLVVNYFFIYANNFY